MYPAYTLSLKNASLTANGQFRKVDNINKLHVILTENKQKGSNYCYFL